MHVMIFGATGNVGSALVARMAETKDHVTALTRQDADILRPFDCAKWIATQRPDVVVNCTAMNGMEPCERAPANALVANCATPMVMAQECREIGALFIHYTTDYVFSGAKEILPLTESHAPNPCGIYGWSKFAGEESIRIIHEGANLIFRLQSIFGTKWAGPLGVIAQALDGHGRSKHDPIKVLHQWCAPTSARLVADATAHVIETLPRERWPSVAGIYHLASSKPVWKRDHAACALSGLLGNIPGGWHVAEGTLTVDRPVYTFLSSLKFTETFGYDFMDWQEDFDHCLPELRRVLEQTRPRRGDG